MIKVIFLLSVITVTSTKVLCQSNENCVLLERALTEIRDSLPNAVLIKNVDIIAKSDYPKLNLVLQNILPNWKIKKAFKKSRKNHSGNLVFCIDTTRLVGRLFADSVRRILNLPPQFKLLNDSISSEISNILAGDKSNEINKRLEVLFNSGRYKMLQNEIKRATNYFLVVNEPINFNDGMVSVLAIDILSNTREIYTQLFVFRKQGTAWLMIKKELH
jgi:hypothetical protein